MSSLVKSVFGGALATLVSAAAMAADVPSVVPVVQHVVMAAPPAPGFDFAGPYVGVAVGAFFFTDEGFEFTSFDVQGQAGYNIVFGRLLVGAEARALGVIESGAPFTVELGADLRAGVLLGNRALLYGRFGIAAFSPTFTPLGLTAGGGVEIGFGQRASVFAETIGYADRARGFYGVDFRAGINLHFGN